MRQPGLSSPHHFLVRNTIMDDNEIFFRKQGIRTTIIVNKMLVLIKMISLFCLFCFFQALLHLSVTIVVVLTPGDIRMVGLS